MNQTMLDILITVLSVCAPALAALASGVLWKLWAKLNLQGVAIDKANMESEINAALKYAIGKVLPQIANKGWDSPEVRNSILAAATVYFRQRFPDRTAQIVSAAQPKGQETPVSPVIAVSETLSARLPDAITVAAASPGTPPVVASP